MSKSLSVSIHTPMRAQRLIPWCGKGEEITLIAELTLRERLTGPLRPFPFFPTPPTTQRLYTKSEQSFIRT